MSKTTLIVILSLALTISLWFHIRTPPTPQTADFPPDAVPSVRTTAPEPDADPEPPEPPKAEPVPEPDPRLAALEAALDMADTMPGLEGAAIGSCLLDADGRVLIDHNARTAVIPASTLKTLTTAAALEILGQDFRFETVIGLAGSRSGDVPDGDLLDGDLILLGGGDPTLALSDLAAWAAELAADGVRHISGRIIGDGRLFDGSVFADFWDWGDIGNGYGSPVSGLNLQHNRFAATFSGGQQEGDPAGLLRIQPEVPGVAWWNQVLTGAPGSGDGVMIYGGERAAVMHLRGTVPPADEFTVRGAVPDPERFAAHHLREALVAAGIEVAGDVVTAAGLGHEGANVPDIDEELRRHPSPPLIEIITSIHARSDNHETECLFRMLGVREGLPPAEVLRRHWAGRGVEFSGWRMVDGSGLARAGHITPHDLAMVQHLAATGPSGETYVASLLPTADGRLRVKPGAMSAIRGYTGLAITGAGEPLAFALMINHFTDPAPVAALRNAVFEALADWQGVAPDAHAPAPANRPNPRRPSASP